MSATTMFEKIWARHVVAEGAGGHVLLYVDVVGPEQGAFSKQFLLIGQDEVDLTLGYAEWMREFEERQRREMPWLSDRYRA